MIRSSTGPRWRKLDLHVHTPASKDYTGPTITPDEFVTKALVKALNGIAATNHITGEWTLNQPCNRASAGLRSFATLCDAVTFSRIPLAKHAGVTWQP